MRRFTILISTPLVLLHVCSILKILLDEIYPVCKALALRQNFIVVEIFENMLFVRFYENFKYIW